MQEENVEKIEGLYKTIVNLPIEHPDKFSLSHSGYKTPLWGYTKMVYASLFASRDSEYFSGIRGRTDSWKKYIIPEWMKLSLEEMAEKEGLRVKITNYAFRSRLSINGSNKIKLDIWSPKTSTLWSHFWGNEIKAKLRKN